MTIRLCARLALTAQTRERVRSRTQALLPSTAVEASANAGERGHFITQQQVPTDLNTSATAQLLAQNLLRNKSRISLFTFILVHSNFARVNVISLVADHKGRINTHEIFEKNIRLSAWHSARVSPRRKFIPGMYNSRERFSPLSLTTYLITVQLLKPGNRSITMAETHFSPYK